nr:PAS domain S-box protein [Edaphobacter lichenicola]
MSTHERSERSGQSSAELSARETLPIIGLDSSFAANALESLPSGFVVIAENGTFLHANEKFLAMVGRDRGELTGLNLDDLLTRGSVIFYETQFLPSLRLRGSLDEIVLTIRRPDGSQVPAFVNAAVHTDESSKLTRFHLSVFGAGQRRLYESELLRARREFEEVAEIVRRSADGIIRLSTRGQVESWNNGAEQIFGYTAVEGKGRTLQSLFIPDAMGDTEERLRRGEEVHRETLALHRSGRSIDVSVSLTPHMEAPGTLVGFSAIIRDTTDRKRAEKALLQSEKLASAGRLASSIAHEINNPLESVTNLLYILSSRVADPETLQYVMTAQEELARVSHIATHTLRFHKQSSNRTEVDLQALADSVLSLYRGRLQNSGIVATTDCQTSPPLLCFEGELRQVLVNLVANAYDAMRHGGKLVIRAHRSRNRKIGSEGVRLLVADNGTGMDSDVQGQLFEPFFSTKGIGGTGLGLWITKDLIAKSGGTIAVRSTTRPGRSGTVISLFFSN